MPSPWAEWCGFARARSAASTSCEAATCDEPRPGSACLSCAGASSRRSGRDSSALVLAQREAACAEGLLDLLDRLTTEVRDRVELRLRLPHELADGLNAGPLQAVVGADAQLELLDQDLIEPVGARNCGRLAGARAVGRCDRTLAAQLIHAVGGREDRQALDQDLGGLAQRGPRLDRAVGLDLERELVEVGPLADSGGVDRVGGAANRREDRVDRDNADRLVVRLVLVRRGVAPASTDGQVHLELGLLLERRDRSLGVEDLHARGQVDVLGLDLARAGGDQWGLDLIGIGVHPDDDILQVEDQVGDVLLQPRNCRELVGHALDADAGDRCAPEGREQHAAEAVAERVAEALVEGLDGEGPLVVVGILARDLRDLEIWQGGHRFHHFSFFLVGGYFEYSSTMSCSSTGAEISLLSGSLSTLALSESWSACSHAGTPDVSSVASRTTSVAALLGLIVITSSGFT